VEKGEDERHIHGWILQPVNERTNERTNEQACEGAELGITQGVNGCQWRLFFVLNCLLYVVLILCRLRFVALPDTTTSRTVRGVL
jgi:hypothetical protein